MLLETTGLFQLVNVKKWFKSIGVGRRTKVIYSALSHCSEGVFFVAWMKNGLKDQMVFQEDRDFGAALRERGRKNTSKMNDFFRWLKKVVPSRDPC